MGTFLLTAGVSRCQCLPLARRIPTVRMASAPGTKVEEDLIAPSSQHPVSAGAGTGAGAGSAAAPQPDLVRVAQEHDWHTYLQSLPSREARELEQLKRRYHDTFAEIKCVPWPPSDACVASSHMLAR